MILYDFARSSWFHALQFRFPRGYGLKPQIVEFLDFCEQKARWTLSHPQIVTKGKDGSLIDDYRLLGSDSWGKGRGEVHQKPTIASLEDMQAKGIHYLILIYFKYHLYIICILFVYYLSICCHVAMLPAVLETLKHWGKPTLGSKTTPRKMPVWWPGGTMAIRLLASQIAPPLRTATPGASAGQCLIK